MTDRIFFSAGSSQSLIYAAGELTKLGLQVTDTPSPNVTHLLLDVPCRASAHQLDAIFASLRSDVKIFGGFLSHFPFENHRCINLLDDEEYLARNARITAHCAIKRAQSQLRVTWDDCPVLILGWGRIGKCLGQLLKALGADVVIAARSPSHRAMLKALGYEAECMNLPAYILGRFRVIFNTIPAPILSAEDLAHCRPTCIKIDLASVRALPGEDIMIARGLPGSDAPESSGRLIARTILRLDTSKEVRT